MTADITFYTWFMPIFGFLFVFVIMFALLDKLKILGDAKAVNIMISFIISIIFVTVASIRQYVQTILPWFAVLIISLFLILLIVGFTGYDKFPKKTLTWIAIAILVIIFLLSAIKVFGTAVTQYLPGNPSDSRFKSFIFSDQFLGAFILAIVAVAATWVLTKK